MRIEVKSAQAGERLDKLVAALGFGRSRSRALFEAGRVHVIAEGGRRTRALGGYKARAGTVIDVQAEERDLDISAVADLDMPLVVVYETDALVVVDKPAAVPSAPLLAGERGCIANALVARYPEMRDVGFSPREPGLCHRLDVGTSGLLMAARTAHAFATLSRAIKDERVAKHYLLVCASQGLPPGGAIDAPLAPDPKNARRVRACLHQDEARRLKAKPASTRYRVIERHGDRALVEATVSRARRHQIRAHLASIGFPLVGDELYGGEPVADFSRHALHASRVCFAGDEGLAGFDVESEMPEEMRALVR